ncbi:hypothetical protein GGR56DRAFT_1974 [Xylariaceae sp. FL0804]|nr:hypothetical protein GGR56DRAFT_1974 [Xylariaceae sp. FL0804]
MEEWLPAGLAPPKSNNPWGSLPDGAAADLEPRILDLKYAPTDEQLKELGQRWLRPDLLRKRLLYCKPFLIRYEVRSRNGQTALVTRNHHELFDIIQEAEYGDFAWQMSRAWPETLGSLVPDVLHGERFLWLRHSPHPDDGTSYVCRKAGPQNRHALLEHLFNEFSVYLEPNDNVLWQIMPLKSTSVLTVPTMAILENLIAPTHLTYVGTGTLNDWFPIQASTPSLYRTGDFGEGDWLCIRLNLRACIPDDGLERVRCFQQGHGVSPEGIGFPLKREAARIPGLHKAADQFAIEYLTSVAFVLRRRHRPGKHSTVKYSVLVWLNYQTGFDDRAEDDMAFPVPSAKRTTDLGLRDCGAGGEGFLQFLVVLSRAIDHWRRCWDTMMDEIDKLIRVELRDTLDKKRWETLMFDDSFQLSEQYFTVLQLLRIFKNWIEETAEGMQNLEKEIRAQSKYWRLWRRKHAPLDEKEWPLNRDILKDNLEKVSCLFIGHAQALQHRIMRKEEEVESLRDGLLNTASLREAYKTKTLNWYIGVFTIVTVFFTPLGFMATFWAIPFMASSRNVGLPSGFLPSFVAVPMLTYVISAAFIVYLWGRSSKSEKTQKADASRPISVWSVVHRTLGSRFSS